MGYLANRPFGDYDKIKYEYCHYHHNEINNQVEYTEPHTMLFFSNTDTDCFVLTFKCVFRWRFVQEERFLDIMFATMISIYRRYPAKGVLSAMRKHGG